MDRESLQHGNWQDADTARSAGRGPVLKPPSSSGRTLYEARRNLGDDQIADIAMTTVSYTNSLRGDEALKRAARHHVRYINNAMIATLLREIAPIH